LNTFVNGLTVRRVTRPQNVIVYDEVSDTGDKGAHNKGTHTHTSLAGKRFMIIAFVHLWALARVLFIRKRGDRIYD